MPKGVRAAAYALLLAMNGYAYDNAHSGHLTRLEVAMLADKLGQRPRPLLAALEAVDLISVTEAEVVLPRFLKWNPEFEISEIRAEAGRAGAMARWGGKEDGKPDGKPDGKAHGNGMAKGPLAIHVAKAFAKTVLEKERDKEGFTPLATSSLTPEALAICQAFEARGCTLTQHDAQDAEGMVSDFRVPTAQQLTAEMLTTDAWREEHARAPIARVIGYRDRFRRLNDSLRDAGQKPRELATPSQA